MKRTHLYFFALLSLLCISCSDGQKTNKQDETAQQNKNQTAAAKNKERKAGKTSDSTDAKTDEDSPQVYKDALQAEIRDVNAKLPVQVEEAVTVTNFTVEGNDAVYYYMCEEPKANMDVIEKASAKMKSGTTNSLKTTNDPETVHLLRMLKNADMGLIFRYKGTKSGRTVDVVFRPAEIKTLRE